MEILKIVLPIFLVIMAGFLLRRYNIVEKSWVHVLNGFVYYVALPSLIFLSFWQLEWWDGEMLKLLFTNVLVMILFSALLLFCLSLFPLKRSIKAGIFLTALVGNTVYMGFPILGEALGESNFSGVVGVATIQLVIGLVLSVLAVEFLVVRSRKFKTYLKDFIRNPLIISLAVGLLLSLFDLRTNSLEIIQKPLAMLAQTASPIALFALGGFLHGKFLRFHLNLTLLVSAVKLLMFPLFMLVALRLLGFWDQSEAISVLVSGMPAAATAFVIAEKYKLDESFVANVILVSTAISIISIPLFLYAYL